jgi:hypothetical protein
MRLFIDQSRRAPRTTLIGDEGKEWLKAAGHGVLACAAFVALWAGAHYGHAIFSQLHIALVANGHAIPLTH